jgi:hypothetical protein
MISITELLMAIGFVICAVSLIAPEPIANYSRARWLQADLSWWKWRRTFLNFLVMKPWYPTFVRFYGLVGVLFFLIYFVFARFSK